MLLNIKISLILTHINTISKHCCILCDRLSVLPMSFDCVYLQDNFMISRLVKMFRAARLIKLLNYGGEMRTLLFVFLKALKSLPHVMFLVMLTFYIYAIIGMQVGHLGSLHEMDALKKGQSFIMFFNKPYKHQSSSIVDIFR